MEIRFTETALRDANQSLIATRLPFAEFEKILPALDRAGYYSLECWGGATFDSCLRYLSEDPWERLRKIRAACPNTRLQMLLRGQNLLGYHHYPDDVVRLFIAKSIENGMDIIRIFDALNDIRNLEVAVDETKKRGAMASGTICYTLSPIHTLESYVSYAKKLVELGVDTICIKDMAGIMGPQDCYDLVKALKAEIKLPVVVHTHGTTGLGSMTLLKAAEAGADVIDTAISSFSNGTSQPPTETMAYTLRQAGFEVGLDDGALKEINDFFKKVRALFLENEQLNPMMMATDADALTYQIPGGMLSNLAAQLRAQNALDKLPEVLEETPRVRRDLGYPPLVTPMSQMVGVQATVNVLLGERYKMIPKEIQAYIRGEYGRAPGEIDPDLQEKALHGEKPMTCRFADTLAPGLEAAKAEIGGLAKNEEDLLSYIAFPQVAREFLEKREKNGGRVPEYVMPGAKPKGTGVMVAPKVNAADKVVKDPKAPVELEQGTLVSADVNGIASEVLVGVGDKVFPGALLLDISALSTESDIVSPCYGVVKQVLVRKDDYVDIGEPLFVIE